MKDYLLISNTKKNKINTSHLDFVSSQLKKYTNEKISYTELSARKAYEWELTRNKYDVKLKNIMYDFQRKFKIDCNFIKSNTNRKKKLL